MVAHHEITRYGTPVAFAKRLGREDRAGVLQQSLEEERATDKKLTAIAESKVNREAARDGSRPAAGALRRPQGGRSTFAASAFSAGQQRVGCRPPVSSGSNAVHRLEA